MAARGDRQDAVRLLADAQRRQRPARPQIANRPGAQLVDRGVARSALCARRRSGSRSSAACSRCVAFQSAFSMWPELAPSSRSAPGTRPTSKQASARRPRKLRHAAALQPAPPARRVRQLLLRRASAVRRDGARRRRRRRWRRSRRASRRCCWSAFPARRTRGPSPCWWLSSSDATSAAADSRRLRPVDAEDDQAIDPAAHLRAVLQVGRR